ncbi:type II toxin-antitoxin system VapC family toxin [Saccharopolyspora hattusasensis]|uniref:type II toxin-antitoxin system VapC family toxin n=1 Tax=Saccharopolyspora hattusasensis TaxID=1128679 RepID=UPI003D9744D1
MTSELPRVVVDTCIIVDFLTGEDEHRQRNARWVLEQDGARHRVVLPAIVLAEVPGTGVFNGDHGGLEARRERVELVQRWVLDSGYWIADLTERLARQAAKLTSEHKIKGPDATVLATALSWGCAALYTRDNNPLKINGAVSGLKITEGPDPPQPEPDLFTSSTA